MYEHRYLSPLQELTREYGAAAAAIENLMRAMEMGAVFPTLATRLSEPERQKKELEIQIADESKTAPKLTKGEIIHRLQRFLSSIYMIIL